MANYYDDEEELKNRLTGYSPDELEEMGITSPQVPPKNPEPSPMPATYTPGPKMQAYQQEIGQEPLHENYHPSMGRRLAAAFFGGATGAAMGPEEGQKSASVIANAPYRRQLQDFQQRLGVAGKEAETEAGQNQAAINYYKMLNEAENQRSQAAERAGQGEYYRQKGAREAFLMSPKGIQAQKEIRASQLRPDLYQDDAGNMAIMSEGKLVDYGTGEPVKPGSLYHKVGTNAQNVGPMATAFNPETGTNTVVPKRPGTDLGPPRSFYAPRNLGVDPSTGQNVFGSALGQRFYGATNPAFVPQTSSRETVVPEVGPDGTVINKVENLKTTRQKGNVQAPGNVQSPQGQGQPSGKTFGQKPLSPEEQMNTSGQVEAMKETRDIASRIKQNVGLLNSLITSGKIALNTDPKTGVVSAVLKKNVPLTDQEAQLASDFSQMAERINILRVPLGAGGFRSKESWNALEGLSGSPGGNPQVIDKVLTDTIGALESQMKVRNKALGTPEPKKNKVYNPQTGRLE